MYHTVMLTDEEFRVLKNIVEKANTTKVFIPTVTPVKKTKTKTEAGLDKLREYRSNKKRKN